MKYKVVEIKDIPWTDRERFIWPKDDAKLHRFIGQVETLGNALKYLPETRRDVCVQAGGAAGIWPLRLSGLFKNVYTFEPYPIMFRCLVSNCSDVENVIPFNAALGHLHQMVSMVHPSGKEDNFGAQHIVPRNEGANIPMLRIDDLPLPALDFICLDVEGAELIAILGGMQAIMTYKPVIMYEDKGHGELFGYKQGYIEQMLSGVGYKVAERIERDVILVAL